MAYIRYNTKTDIKNFGKLKLTEKIKLQKAAQDYFRRQGIFDSAYFVVKKELINVSENYKSYKVLLAEFNTDETGSIIIPHSTRIITDISGNIVYVLKQNGFKNIENQKVSINDNSLFECGM